MKHVSLSGAIVALSLRLSAMQAPGNSNTDATPMHFITV